MIFRRIGALFVLVLVRPHSILVSAQNNSDDVRKLIRDYDKRICDNKPSCDLADSVQKDRLTLKKRNCMCDFECTEFDDCCQDSPYFGVEPTNPKKYFCHAYSSVYLVESCASDYQDKSVIAKCEQGARPLESDDYDIIIPVTNVEKRVSYANKFCAQCNNDQTFVSWDFQAGCTEPAGGETSSPLQTSSTARPSQSPSTTRPTAAPKSNNRPATETAGKKFETKAKTNAVSNPVDYIGGCRSENSPCRDEGKKPEYYPTFKPHPLMHPAPKYVWPGNGTNGAVNIRIEIGNRFKRQQTPGTNYAKYKDQIGDLIKRAKYDPSSKNLVVTSNDGKNLICRVNATYPTSLADVVRTCVPNVITTCSNGGTCPSYTSFAYEKSSRMAYRNRECAACNGVADSSLTGCLEATRSGGASKDLASTSTKSQNAKSELLSGDDIGT